MSRLRTPISSRRGIKIDDKLRREEFFRVVPIKQALSVRIDAEVIAWLKSQGPGYQTRINEILRERMAADGAEQK